MAAAELDPQRINLIWLIKLRWAAIASQVITIVAVALLIENNLPVPALLALVGVEALTNVAARLLVRRAGAIRERWIVALMALDILIFSALLYLTGGPTNPFSFLYLVQIALAAVVLPPRRTWALVALALVCSGTLFFRHREVVLGGTHNEHMALHLYGMWVAFGVAAAFIVYFLMRVTRALAARDTELAASRALALRQERLASLATLAAGAAHELATPLSTIAVAAKELERRLDARRAKAASPPQPIAGGAEPSGTSQRSCDAGRSPQQPSQGSALDEESDVRLIRSQVDRCREILDRMAADAGHSAGEIPEVVSVQRVVETAVSGLRERPAVRVEMQPQAATREVHAPARALGHALRGLVKNAQEASQAAGASAAAANGAGPVVAVQIIEAGRRLSIDVRDHGCGMSREVLVHAGEPFFTTKAPGAGMGLGVFLARSLIEKLGGELRLDSEPGRGTTVTVTLPLADEKGST